MGSESMVLLTRRVKVVKDLHLTLTHNGIDGVGVALLVHESFMKEPQELNLSHNSIGSDAAAALAGGLKNTSNRKSLDLSYNYIGSDGATALAGGFKSKTKLLILDLSHNTFGPGGSIALAGVLKEMPDLHTLLLSNNGNDCEGSSALACVVNDTHLKVVIQSNNNIGYEGAQSLLAH